MTATLSTLKPGMKIRVSLDKQGKPMLFAPNYATHATATVISLGENPNLIVPAWTIVTDLGSVNGRADAQVTLG